MGTPAAAAVSLKRLLDAGHHVAAVYTQPDRPAGRGNKVAFSAVKELALEYGLLVRQPEKIRTAEALEEFSSLQAEVAVVVAYGRILPEGFLTAFAGGAINVHFSLLPKYRGAAPVNWAIVNGEEVTGVTTIQMDTGLDTGDVLGARATEIGPNETAPELMLRLSDLGADVLIETLDGLYGITARPQRHEGATFAPILKRNDGNVDWSMTAKEIATRVRGFQPFPGTFSFLGGKRVVFWSATEEAEPVKAEGAVGGEIVSLNDGRLSIAAGKGTVLAVDEIQFEGKKRVPVSDILNGIQIAVGECFGRN